jgi:fructoselysine-6-P-deglycase FrlB-like protein
MPTPTLREAAPWAMQEMIEAEPELARTVLGQSDDAGALAHLVRSAAAADERVTVTGCGSSEHAALAVAALLDEALAGAGFPRGTVVSRQAFEAALEPWAAWLLIGVSHEGETAATLAALTAGRGQGSRTVLLTANPDGPLAAEADVVFRTPLVDRSWCHTVGYLSPLLAGAATAAAIAGRNLDAPAFADFLAEALDLRGAAAEVAAGLAGARSFVAVGSGIDAVAARELALKIEEGVRLPAVARDTETELHGHLVSAAPTTALIAVVADPRSGPVRAERATQLLRVARRLGMPTAAIVSASADAMVPADATSAGRLVLPQSPGATQSGPIALAAAALGSAVALQLLTLALLTQEGRNPDLIGRENTDQREAAAIASESFPI